MSASDNTNSDELEFSAWVWMDDAWEECFNGMPYTSFWMIDYLIGKVGINYESYLLDPDILKRSSMGFLKNPPTDFKDLIALPGRCTSFAIQVVDRLKDMPDAGNRFDFQFFDFDFHRSAWCAKTKHVIDSSSLDGSTFLREGEWLSLDGQRQWKATDDLSKLKSGNKLVRPSNL